MPAPAARRALRLLLFGAIAAAASAFDQVDAPDDDAADDDAPDALVTRFGSDGEPTAALRQLLAEQAAATLADQVRAPEPAEPPHTPQPTVEAVIANASAAAPVAEASIVAAAVPGAPAAEVAGRGGAEAAGVEAQSHEGGAGGESGGDDPGAGGGAGPARVQAEAQRPGREQREAPDGEQGGQAELQEQLDVAAETDEGEIEDEDGQVEDVGEISQGAGEAEEQIEEEVDAEEGVELLDGEVLAEAEEDPMPEQEEQRQQEPASEAADTSSADGLDPAEPPTDGLEAGDVAPDRPDVDQTAAGAAPDDRLPEGSAGSAEGETAEQADSVPETAARTEPDAAFRRLQSSAGAVTSVSPAVVRAGVDTVITLTMDDTNAANADDRYALAPAGNCPGQPNLEASGTGSTRTITYDGSALAGSSLVLCFRDGDFVTITTEDTTLCTLTSSDSSFDNTGSCAPTGATATCEYVDGVYTPATVTLEDATLCTLVTSTDYGTTPGSCSAAGATATCAYVAGTPNSNVDGWETPDSCTSTLVQTVTTGDSCTSTSSDVAEQTGVSVWVGVRYDPTELPPGPAACTVDADCSSHAVLVKTSGTAEAPVCTCVCARGYSGSDCSVVDVDCVGTWPPCVGDTDCSFTAGDSNSCGAGCTYTAPVAESAAVPESCNADADCTHTAGVASSCPANVCVYDAGSDSCTATADCSFSLGDSNSCGIGCTYVPPANAVRAVIEACAPDCGFTPGDQSTCGGGCDYQPAVAAADAVTESCAGTASEVPGSCTGDATEVAATCTGGTGTGGEQCDLDASTTSGLDDNAACPAGCTYAAAYTPDCDLEAGTPSGLPDDAACPAGCTDVAAYTPDCDLSAATDGTADCPGGCTYTPFSAQVFERAEACSASCSRGAFEVSAAPSGNGRACPTVPPPCFPGRDQCPLSPGGRAAARQAAVLSALDARRASQSSERAYKQEAVEARKELALARVAAARAEATATFNSITARRSSMINTFDAKQTDTDNRLTESDGDIAAARDMASDTHAIHMSAVTREFRNSLSVACNSTAGLCDYDDTRAPDYPTRSDDTTYGPDDSRYTAPEREVLGLCPDLMQIATALSGTVPETCTPNPCAGYVPGTGTTAGGDYVASTTCPSGCLLAGSDSTDETCTPIMSAAQCSAAYTPGTVDVPSTTCNTAAGCVLTEAVTYTVNLDADPWTLAGGALSFGTATSLNRQWTTATFAGGSSVGCPGEGTAAAIGRSATVAFRPGDTASISVAETSACVFAITFTTPLCRDPVPARCVGTANDANVDCAEAFQAASCSGTANRVPASCSGTAVIFGVTCDTCGFTAGDSGSCPNGCDYTGPVAAVPEACEDADDSGDDCSGFTAGDPNSCGSCDYTAPVAEVVEACALSAGAAETDCTAKQGCVWSAESTPTCAGQANCPAGCTVDTSSTACPAGCDYLGAEAGR